MAHIKDVAMTMVNESIKLAKQKGERYYLNITKLHNLLYLSQCYMLSFHKRNLFDSRIGAYAAGAYVEGIRFVVAEKGFEPIKSEFRMDRFFIPSFSSFEVIKEILTTFGKMDSDNLQDLVLMTLPLQDFRDELIRGYGITAATMTSEDLQFNALGKLIQGEKWFDFTTDATITIQETHMSQMKDFFLQIGCNEPTFRY